MLEFLSTDLRSHRAWRLALVGLVLLLAASQAWPAALAQEATPTTPAEGAVYVVQEGDNLWSIALRFGVSLAELQQANGMNDASPLGLGDRLVIPGLEGFQGVLVTEEVPFGETLQSLSRRYGVPVETLLRLNHLTSPAELFAGTILILPEERQQGAGGRAVLDDGESLLELAVLSGLNPWSVLQGNGLAGASQVLPGDVLHLPGSEPGEGQEPDEGLTVPGALPPQVESVVLKPQPFVQGAATVVEVQAPEGATLSGTLGEYALNFFWDGEGKYFALQGLHAMAEPGLYPLSISGSLPGGQEFAFMQSVFVRAGDYLFDPVLTVSPETIDPTVTRPEDAEWSALAAPASSERLWNGIFTSPAPEPFQECWPSLFGSRRSYNGSAYTYFHTGLDFCGGVGTEIFAPAAGRVVFAGPLTVRGNATMIDHGWGVYTGYMHQSEVFVKPGEMVEAGQVIGLVGGTGRVTGPHLHWEVWVGGIQVEPMDWLEQAFP